MGKPLALPLSLVATDDAVCLRRRRCRRHVTLDMEDAFF
jgi:hypothetical protein